MDADHLVAVIGDVANLMELAENAPWTRALKHLLPEVSGMQIEVDPRAMVAIRSLSVSQRANVEKIFGRLSDANEGNWMQIADAKPLQVMAGQQLYSIRAGSELRLLSKIISGALIVQDVFARERLEQISGRNLE